MKRLFQIIIIIAAMCIALCADAKGPQVAPSFAWEMAEPLGTHVPATIDTTLFNYGQLSVPAQRTLAYATTGNQGAAGMNMIYFGRKPMSDFYFRDALSEWLPMQGNHKYYNTRIPMTLLSYNTAGGSETSTDRLKATFSGNAGPRIQIGADIDYLYSKGCYANEAAKNLIWGLSGSYMGDRYELQTFFNHYSGLNKDNGGITDDLYITDPAQLQGGESSIESTAIPTNLSQARTRLKGQEFFMNHRYKFGFWKVTPPVDTIPEDTVEHREFVPVTSVIWTFDYTDAEHVFYNDSPEEGDRFWDNHYLTTGMSNNPTRYFSMSNTIGIALHEGFNKYAKAGLSAFLTHELRRYWQTDDTTPISGPDRPEILTPYPYDSKIDRRASENFLWVGAQLSKQQGSLLRYDATARIGVVGRAAGEIMAKGNVSTRFKLLGDTVTVTGYGMFSNENAPYLMNNYVSNYFIWKNDFGKIRRLRFGGMLDVPQTRTRLNIGVENVQNYIYFNDRCLPQQYGGSVQVLSASLEQNFKVGALHWDNRLTYQTSSEDAVLPLPKFAVYSNLYVHFRVAKVLQVQFGVDCSYYTKYYAPGYQPATMGFYNQREIKVGNYPFMNVYANMKLKKARFYVMMSHVNQGLMGDNYFSMPHYPLDPRRFQMGISIDFAN